MYQKFLNKMIIGLWTLLMLPAYILQIILMAIIFCFKLVWRCIRWIGAFIIMCLVFFLLFA